MLQHCWSSMHQGIGTSQPNYRKSPHLPFAIVWGRKSDWSKAFLDSCAVPSFLLSLPASLSCKQNTFASVSSEPPVIVGNRTKTGITTW